MSGRYCASAWENGGAGGYVILYGFRGGFLGFFWFPIAEKGQLRLRYFIVWSGLGGLGRLPWARRGGAIYSIAVGEARLYTSMRVATFSITGHLGRKKQRRTIVWGRGVYEDFCS